MDMNLKITSYPKDPIQKNIFSKIFEDIRGGLLLNRDNLKSDTVWLEKGAPVELDVTERTATLVKTAEIYADADGTATKYKIKKNHQLVLGDYVGHTVGGKAYEITAIDTTNSGFDEVTLDTTIGAVSAGDVLIESAATARIAFV